MDEAFNNLLEGLNPEQRKAAETFYGPLLILAGAGTGKTKVITSRIAAMLAAGIEGSSIVALSFTNKAAHEMCERLALLVGRKRSERVLLSTFHSFALKVLREHSVEAGLRPGFGIASESEAENLLKDAITECRLEELVELQRAKEKISSIKDNLYSSENLMSSLDAFERAFLAPLFTAYQRRLRLFNLVDFDDLVYLAAMLMRNNRSTLIQLQDSYKFLLVDEYQDTSMGQLEFIKLLAGQNQNVCAVGDDDQSIYSWRGARPDAMHQFLRSFPASVVVTLEQNYRCAQNILHAANAVIAKNSSRMPKTLWSEKAVQHPIRLHLAENEKDEADFVANEILDLVTKGKCAFQNIAVLVRSNAQTQILERIFEARNIPFAAKNTSSFFEKKEVKDLFSLVNLVLNPFNFNALFRVLGFYGKLPIGVSEYLQGRLAAQLQVRSFDKSSYFKIICDEIDKTQRFNDLTKKLQKLLNGLETCNNAQTLLQILRNAAEEFGIKAAVLTSSPSMKVAQLRLQALDRAIEILTQKETVTGQGVHLQHQLCNSDSKAFVLEEFLDRFQLKDARVAGLPEASDAVQIMSMHASKGLEFHAVFLVGLEDGVLPHERGLEVCGGEQEERRLFYVALTRAKSLLYLTHCSFRAKGHAGKEKEPKPSRFLSDIPEHLLNFTETDPAAEEAKRMAAARRLFDLFR